MFLLARRSSAFVIPSPALFPKHLGAHNDPRNAFSQSSEHIFFGHAKWHPRAAPEHRPLVQLLPRAFIALHFTA